MALAKEAYNPRLTLEHWIEENKFIPSVVPTGVKSIDDIKEKKTISNKTTDTTGNKYRQRTYSNGWCIACRRQSYNSLVEWKT